MELVNYQGKATQIELNFEVVEAVGQLKITVNKAAAHWCHVLIYAGHNCRGQFLLTNNEASKAFYLGTSDSTTTATGVSGELAVKDWHLICESEAATDFTITVEYSSDEQPVAETNVSNIRKFPPQREKKGWLKGDFHTHTIHSDGKMSPAENLATAQQQQLDFFVATDHNVVTQIWPVDQVAVYSGTELTTPFGHANYLAITETPFQTYQAGELATPEAILSLIEDNQDNGIFSINHPFLAPWEWQIGNLPLKFVSAIEICNDPTYFDNQQATEKALQFWSLLWNSGWKIAGLGGSDSHLLPIETYPDSNIPSLIGDPGTFVYVEDTLNATNLIKGIQAGRTIISRIGRISLKEETLGEILPGEKLTQTTGKLMVESNTSQDLHIQWIRDGEIIKEEQGQQSEYVFNESNQHFHWLRVDIRSQTGEFLATINPVYWGEREPLRQTWNEVLNQGVQ